MTLLHEAVDAKKFDVRVVERNVTRGSVRLDDYQKSVNSLPDDSENAEYTSIETLAGNEDKGSS